MNRPGLILAEYLRKRSAEESRLKEAPWIGQIGYWRMPSKDDDAALAYVEIDAHGAAVCMGWGDKRPAQLQQPH